MVAVQDEVGLPDLVELDRWQILAPVEHPVNALPPLPHTRPGGQKRPVESPTASNAATYLLHLHDPRAPIDRTNRALYARRPAHYAPACPSAALVKNLFGTEQGPQALQSLPRVHMITSV